ncbi:hypothetical protein [Paenibacillus tyrfis]|uniref:hypothetical protein n=1 Tax=Paenibacillus tyrfis TaxID=1501230 RepID=UPI000B597023|nr:hypothetical protein [Paenibacillus tyrfis]
MQPFSYILADHPRGRNQYDEAGLAVGFWAGLEELEQLQGFDRTFEPACDDLTRERKYEGWRQVLSYQLKDQINHQ